MLDDNGDLLGYIESILSGELYRRQKGVVLQPLVTIVTSKNFGDQICRVM